MEEQTVLLRNDEQYMHIPHYGKSWCTVSYGSRHISRLAASLTVVNWTHLYSRSIECLFTLYALIGRRRRLDILKLKELFSF